MAELKQILDELGEIAGRDRLKTDPAVTAEYAVDGVVPKAVVFPKDTRMVAAVVQCADRRTGIAKTIELFSVVRNLKQSCAYLFLINPGITVRANDDLPYI